MLNESECSKKFKKIADKLTASTKKEVRISKEYIKSWNNYSTINEILGESTKNLNSVSLIERKKTQKVDALKQIHEDREEELNKVKRDIQALEEKILALQKNESGAEKNKSPIEKLLKMNVLKICTKTHISNINPHVIRGFTANTDHSDVFPFEIDTGRKTKNEIEETLWDNSLRCSGHANQWNYLFNSSSE